MLHNVLFASLEWICSNSLINPLQGLPKMNPSSFTLFTAPPSTRPLPCPPFPSLSSLPLPLHHLLCPSFLPLPAHSPLTLFPCHSSPFRPLPYPFLPPLHPLLLFFALSLQAKLPFALLDAHCLEIFALLVRCSVLHGPIHPKTTQM